MKKIISNCPLCEEHSLHVVGEEESQVMQCINCGYVSSTKFIGNKETNEEYKKLTDDMKSWVVEKNDRIWIPTILTLPIGMLYPIGDDDMKWAFAPMVEIPEEERKKYPNESGGHYERKIDTDNPTIYDKFVDGMVFINEKMKNLQ
jgi:Zn ribbon nucleic-acid-binding protein